MSDSIRRSAGFKSTNLRCLSVVEGGSLAAACNSLADGRLAGASTPASACTSADQLSALYPKILAGPTFPRPAWPGLPFHDQLGRACISKTSLAGPAFPRPAWQGLPFHDFSKTSKGCIVQYSSLHRCKESHAFDLAMQPLSYFGPDVIASIIPSHHILGTLLS